MRIPLDPIGYSVSADAIIHTRYASDHADGAQRTRTEKGVTSLLNGKKPKLCAVCFPSPQYASPDRSTPQKRRTPPK